MKEYYRILRVFSKTELVSLNNIKKSVLKNKLIS